MDRSLIQQFAAGGPRLRLAIAGLSPEELLAFPIPGKWSIQQVVLHLADAELAFIDRMKRIIAEDNPPLLAWDENRFTSELFYADQSADDAATIVELARRQMTRVLDKLPDAAFQRTGIHSARGPQTLAKVIEFDIWHLDHHLKFLYEKRQKLGK